MYSSVGGIVSDDAEGSAESPCPACCCAGCRKCARDAEQRLDGGLLPGFKARSLTSTVTAAQVLLFLVTWVAGLASPGNSTYLGPNTCVLYAAGAKFGPPVRFHGHVQRLLLPVLLHANVAHLVVNVFSQLRLMFVFEADNVMGPRRLALAYALCGVAGSALSVIASPYSLSVGASGALFGVFGLDVVLLWSRWPGLDAKHRTALATSLGSLLALNLFIGLSVPGIDVTAHLGGLLCGLVVGPCTIVHEDLDAWRRLRIASAVATVALLAALIGGIWLVPMHDVQNFCQ